MMRRSLMHRWFWLIPTLLVLAACGGNNSAPASVSSSATARPVATMPPARFTAVAQQVFTDTARLTTPAADTVTTPQNTPGPDLSRGATVYGNRCASCHGEQGEGVTGKAEPITEFELSYSEFDTLLRTGGNGTLGNQHLFGPNTISPSGMQALYAYFQSLLE